MSRETSEWLNSKVLVGFTEKRGKAWHYRKGADNHYTGPVPVEDVHKRLFDWEAVEVPVMRAHELESGLVLPEGVITGKKERYHGKTGHSFGIFNADHQQHRYAEWLVEKVGTILDDDLQIGTAGLLRQGGQAWVQIESPDNVEFAGGIKGRPFLLAYTSMDGSLATTYGGSVTSTVCDNTMTVARGEHGGYRKKYRHSKNATFNVSDVRDALGVVYGLADAFNDQVKELLETPVSPPTFEEIIESEFPGEKPVGSTKGTDWATWTKVQKRRDFVRDLYRFDERVAPWTGTAMGVWQAFNTYQQHEVAIRKNTDRVERNAGNMLKGETRKSDLSLLAKLGELV